MIEYAYAKVNLTLEIVGEKDGYHLLESLVIPINLYDTLTFFKSEKDEVISNVFIEDNNIYKAINLFKEVYFINECVKIILDKRIPIGSGLGGGSANISATLRGLNRFFNINAPLKELEPLANQLGSDTLFCLYNKRAFVYGRGDQIEFYPSKEKLNILLIQPKTYLLTKSVFRVYHELKENQPYINYEEKLKEEDMSYIIKHAKNDLLTAALKSSSLLQTVYVKLKNENIDIHLSGSGPTLYLINPTKKQIKNVEKICKNEIIQKCQEI